MEILKGGQRPQSDPDFKVLRSLFFGEGGVGKSTAALTFPSPLYILNCDKPISNLLQTLPEHYEIHYERLDVEDSDRLTKQRAALILTQANAVINAAVKHGEGCTLFLDGADNLHEAVKTALLPEKGDNIAREFADVNNWWSVKFNRLSKANVNWVMTAFARPEWIGQTKTSGKMLPEGWKWMKRWLIQSVYFYIKTDQDPDELPSDRPQGKPLEFRAQITEAKDKKGLVGRTLPTMNYKLLYKLCFGDLPVNHDKLWVPEYQ